MNRSGAPISLTVAFTPRAAKSSRTALPRPPTVVFSSMITTLADGSAASMIVFSSSGLMNRASMTAASIPST